jgi:acetyl-CoA C-acetyltransferase
MPDAFIVDAVRTPVGRRGGGLSDVQPADLAGHVLQVLLDRTGIDPAAVDDVILGCVSQVGAQASNVARRAWLAAGLPATVPGTTLDRQCGSSQQAIHFAAQAVMSGTQDVVVAGGVEVMSMVPIGSPSAVGVKAGLGHPAASEGFLERFGEQEVSQFRGAELIADHWRISRTEMEEFALRSHRSAAAAWDDGHYDDEVVPYGEVTHDEGFRPSASLEKMAALPPLPGRRLLTPALASQISDGASAVLIASEEALRRHDLRPRARVHAMTVVGSDPIMMLSGPIPATGRVLECAGLALDDIDLFEVNEAFAPVVLAWLRETGAPLERTNVDGGAIALGHPLGATGAKLMAHLVCALERTGGRYGLQTMCEGGGMANATIVERV